MNRKDPYSIIRFRHITEKTQMLLQLQDSESNASVRRCNAPKYVFLVDPNANKREIAQALEIIYKEQGIKVTKVNTINVKPKTRRVRGRLGKTAAKKKAVVTLEPKDSLDNV